MIATHFWCYICFYDNLAILKGEIYELMLDVIISIPRAKERFGAVKGFASFYFTECFVSVKSYFPPAWKKNLLCVLFSRSVVKAVADWASFQLYFMDSCLFARHCPLTAWPRCILTCSGQFLQISTSDCTDQF